MAKNINIGGRLHSIATGNVVVETNEVFDTNKGKKQNQLNTEMQSSIDAEIERAAGVEEGLSNRLEAVEQLAEISVQGGTLELATSSSDIESGSSKVPTANAVNEVLQGIGYFECSTDADISAKTITATGYSLRVGGNIRIKMTNANTADAVTLNINGTGAKALFYNGAQAGANNSWEEGEVVEVYYDGTNYQASNTMGGGNLSIIHEIDTTTEYTDKDVAGADAVQVALDELINDEETLAKALIDLNNNKANKEVLPDMEELELVTATALTDLKGREIPNAFVQEITLNKLVEDGAYYANGLITADGSIYGNNHVGIHYIFANNNYNKIYAKTQVRSDTKPGNGVIAFYSSSDDISVQSFISSIQVSAFGKLVEYYANVPANTKLISVSFGANNSKVIFEGQDIKVYRDIKKINFRPIVNNLITQSSDKSLSSAMGAKLYSDMFHNDAAHVRTMQKGKPFMKNVFLDCGRKFFSVANIKRIIDKMATVDLRNLILDYSNHQGFRFALNDMSITTDDGITYDISQGLSMDYLSESDMNELFTYAKNKNVNIIGGLNLPGHAMALLRPIFNISGINLDSETQQQFAAAVTEKYATYFESKGAAYYYLGGDESGKHAKYGFFMNRMMHIILKHNMIPLIWNDQICRSDQGGINNPYINDGAICMFWGANNQGAQTIERNNFQQINSSMSIYWVLGPNNNKVTIEGMNNFNINVFQGNSTVRKNIVGAQFCMWMDGAGGVEDLDNDGTDVVDRCLPLIEAFGNTIMNQTGIARTSTYRPTNPTAGDFFYDTTINKPIWYNGTNWVDATGTNV